MENTDTTGPEPRAHPKDPLHGVNLQTILTRIVERHGWREMADRIPVRCFMFDPSITSSLTFLRKTPWARKRLEDWYAFDLTDPTPPRKRDSLPPGRKVVRRKKPGGN